MAAPLSPAGVAGRHLGIVRLHSILDYLQDSILGDIGWTPSHRRFGIDTLQPCNSTPDSDSALEPESADMRHVSDDVPAP